MGNKVRVDLIAIDTWRTILGQINDDCMADIKDISSTITNLGSFKGHTSDKVKEYADEILKKANTAHNDLAEVQKGLIAVEEKAVSI